jgi:hypothetical protein
LSTPSTKLSEYSLLLFGEKKIGKTSFAAQFPDAMFLMFEPGGKALRIYQALVSDWPTFVAYVDELEESDGRFTTVVLDTVDLAYDRCFSHVCSELGIDHPNDERDYGKTWGVIENEFIKQLSRLLNMVGGTVFLSHDQLREVTHRDGTQYDRLGPSMPKQASRFLEGVVDIWAYYGYWGRERRILIRGDELIGAGCRLEENFRTLSGEPVVTIPGGASAKEAYQNFTKAFRNKLADDGASVMLRKKTTRSK